MPASKLRCQWCNKRFYACRFDTKWCSQRCRNKARFEDAKFEFPNVPQSGVPGITFNRRSRRWYLREGPKYFGSFRTVEEALEFKKSVGLSADPLHDDHERQEETERTTVHTAV